MTETNEECVNRFLGFKKWPPHACKSKAVKITNKQG